MKLKSLKSIFTIITLLLYSTIMMAQTTNTAGNWATAGNWSSPSSVPTSTSGSIATPVQVNHAMVLNQNLTITTGVYYIYGNTTDAVGGTAYTLTMNPASYVATTGILDIKSGVTTIEGAVSLSNATVYVRSGATLITGALTTATASKIIIDAGGTWIVNGSVTDNNTSTGLITVNGLFQISGSYTSSTTTSGLRVGPSPATTGQMLVGGVINTQNAGATVFGSTNNATGTFNSGRGLACGASGNAYTSTISGGYTQSGVNNLTTMTHSVSTGTVASRVWEVSTTDAGSGFSSTGVTTAAYTSAPNQTVNKWYRVAYTISGCSGSPTLYTYPVAQIVTTGTNTWTGVTSTDWGTATNWSQGTVPSVTSDVVIPSGTTFAPTTPNSNLNLRSLTVNSSATLTLHANGYYNTISDGLVNNGTITGGANNLEFIGGTQTVSGSSKTIFDRIKVSNSTLSFESDVDLVKEMTFSGSSNSVDFDGSSNNKVFTLESTDDAPDNSARIGEVPSGTTLSGNVKWKRYITKPASNMWITMGSAVNGGTVAQLQQTHKINGVFTGSNGSSLAPPNTAYTISNIRWYDETEIGDDADYADGIPDLEDGVNRFPVSSNTETFDAGKGYYLWLWTTSNPLLSATSASYALTGTVNYGNIGVTITNTNSSTVPANDGWNWLANPYTSFIDISTGFTNIDKTTNIFSITDYENSGSSPFRAYNATTEIGVNGGSKYVAPGQQFWVQADINDGYGSKTVTFTEAMKVSTPAGGQYYRQTGIDDVLRMDLLQTSTPTFTEETVVHFFTGATSGVDLYYDVPVRDGRSNASPSAFGLSSSVSGTELAINALSPSAITSSTVYLNTFSPNGTSLTLKFDANSLGSFADNVGLRLTDLQTSTIKDLRYDGTDYVFTAVSNQSSPRFKLDFTTRHTVTGSSVDNGTVGTTVLITGTGFSTTPANNIVKFNGTTATVSAATSTQLTVTVPSGATTGIVTVKVGDFTVKKPTSFSVANPTTGYKISIRANNTAAHSGTADAHVYARVNGGAWIDVGKMESNGTTCGGGAEIDFIKNIVDGDIIDLVVEEGRDPVLFYAGTSCPASGTTYVGSRRGCAGYGFQFVASGQNTIWLTVQIKANGRYETDDQCSK